MAMYELTIIRSIPPKNDNPGWCDMIHLPLDCESIEQWTRDYSEEMATRYPGTCFTFITHYEEFNSPETYNYPRSIEMDHIK